jgi:hypothetical protein
MKKTVAQISGPAIGTFTPADGAAVSFRGEFTLKLIVELPDRWDWPQYYGGDDFYEPLCRRRWLELSGYSAQRVQLPLFEPGTVRLRLNFGPNDQEEAVVPDVVNIDWPWRAPSRFDDSRPFLFTSDAHAVLEALCESGMLQFEKADVGKLGLAIMPDWFKAFQERSYRKERFVELVPVSAAEESDPCIYLPKKTG